MEALTNAVGEVLRRVRRLRGLTMHEVAEHSGGWFKPSAVGGYERGERGISLARFCRLAAIYGVSADHLLADALASTAPAERTGVVIDLTRLHLLRRDRAGAVVSFVHDVRARRGDYEADVISLRASDIERLALVTRVDPPALLATLQPILRTTTSS